MHFLPENRSRKLSHFSGKEISRYYLFHFALGCRDFAATENIFQGNYAKCHQKANDNIVRNQGRVFEIMHGFEKLKAIFSKTRILSLI